MAFAGLKKQINKANQVSSDEQIQHRSVDVGKIWFAVTSTTGSNRHKLLTSGLPEIFYRHVYLHVITVSFHCRNTIMNVH